MAEDPIGTEIITSSEEETDVLGRQLARISRPGMTVGLDGPLGAGKTRLVRAWAEALGVSPDAISSPTFVLIHEYEGEYKGVGGFPVYHFDAYRLGSPEQFEAIGGPEYWLRGDGLCLIEWADKVGDLLPLDVVRIRIGPVEGQPGARRFVITGLETDWL